MQFKAGLRPYDYQNRYSFMLKLVLAQAAITGLNAIQGTINMGMLNSQIMVDGLQYKTGYDPKGAFNALIEGMTRQRDELLGIARNFTAGPVFTTI